MSHVTYRAPAGQSRPGWRSGSRALIAVVAACGLIIGTASAAQADDVEASKAAYAAGMEAFERGDYESAIEAYEEGYDHSPRPGFLHNIAICHEKLADWEQAKTYYMRYLVEAPEADDAGEVRAKLLELDKRLAGETVAPAGPDEDGAAKEMAPEDLEPGDDDDDDDRDDDDSEPDDDDDEDWASDTAAIKKAAAPKKERHFGVGITGLTEQGWGGILRFRIGRFGLEAAAGYFPVLFLVYGDCNQIGLHSALHVGGNAMIYILKWPRKFMMGVKFGGFYNTFFGPGGRVGAFGELNFGHSGLASLAFTAGITVSPFRYKEFENWVYDRCGTGVTVSGEATALNVIYPTFGVSLTFWPI